MQLSSPAFQNNGIIPSKYTCEGKNIHPPLEIHHVPKEAKSLALIMDDPDVPAFVRPDRMYDHWILFNIPPDATKIEEGKTPPGTHGKNTSGKDRYIGPCPPDAQHRYFFKLYALDVKLNLEAGCTKKELEKTMEGHIIAQTKLIGLYEKGKGY